MFEAHFQTFDEPEGGVALTARLASFRDELLRRRLTGFVIPRADQQQNEYVAPSEERLAWLTGFTGSAGLATVLLKEAALFVDGRYTLQAAKQVDGQAWQIAPLVDPPPEAWLTAHLSPGDRLGFDRLLGVIAELLDLLFLELVLNPGDLVPGTAAGKHELVQLGMHRDVAAMGIGLPVAPDPRNRAVRRREPGDHLRRDREGGQEHGRLDPRSAAVAP